MHGSAPNAIERTTDERLAYRPEEIAEKLGVGRRHVYTLINKGKLRHVVLAGRWMVLADDLTAFVDALKADRDAHRDGPE